MSLLKTRLIQVGTVLAYTGISPDDGLSFFYGSASDFALAAGDVVKVIDIDRSRRAETPWAKVTVAVLKGKFVGRIGFVGIDFSARLQRSWQNLTPTGSMAPVRASGKHAVAESSNAKPLYSGLVEKGADDDEPTMPASPKGLRRAGYG